MELQQIVKECENSLFTYAQMMFPERYFGDVHRDMFRFFQESLEYAMETGEGDNAAALIPRDHQKSFCIAVALSWVITKYPWVTAVYVSSNPTLTEKQLQIVKNIFQSDIHRELWPLMLNYEEGRTGALEHKPKGSWTKSVLTVDHPLRPKSEKDPTVEATSAKSTNTGSHFKICIFDDLVTNENYLSPAEREDLKEVYQSFASIATTGSIIWAVGTRYGDNDLYAELKTKSYTVYDEQGEVVEERPLWKWFERVVEDSRTRDGSGNYVWPRQKMSNGGWFGFNQTELSKKKASAFNLELFYAQYYNDPNAADTDNVNPNCFQYADPKHLTMKNGTWFYGDKQLKTHCGMDLAFTDGNGIKKIRRDYTAISVIAWDEDGYLYVLEQKRFQTSKIEMYYKELMELFEYWQFKEVTIESNVGGSVVSSFIQDEVRKYTTNLIVKGQPSSKNKQERIEQTLIPMYRNQSVFHFKGGYCKQLEEELRLTRPPHDDLKDSLYIAVANSPRQKRQGSYTSNRTSSTVVQAGNRFFNRRRRA